MFLFYFLYIFAFDELTPAEKTKIEKMKKKKAYEGGRLVDT